MEVRGSEEFGPRVLVAEDNVVQRELLIALLTTLGYRVDGVGNGQLALDAMDRDAFDAVLMDCDMPVLDGFDATRAIRNRPPPMNGVPVIALTMLDDDVTRSRCAEVGMNEFIVKPLHLPTIHEALRRHVGPSRGN